MCHVPCHKKESKKKDAKVPYLAAAKNFMLAKKLARENLEHEPLPDTITEALYRKMQLHRDCEPGLVLKDGNYATGVGWKGYPGYGATRCTKLRVFRPKTSGNDRPPSICSFDKKWRFIRQQKVTPIELAICWDMCPVNPKQEPKRSLHIDGTNFSAGPAVFHMVETPKEPATVEEACSASQACESELSNKNAIFTNLAQPTRPKTAWDTRKHKHCSSTKSDDTNISNVAVKRAQSAYNLHHKSNSSNTSISSNLSKKEFCKSSPNLAEPHYHCVECFKQKTKLPNSRLCVACELKNAGEQESRPKSDYKMAFKAGVPNNYSVSTNSSSNACKYIKVPKQRDPYSNKNYSIKSLGAPFSLQKGKRDDYPEHWRLASVYQHSYKPVHTRKRPLLATVYQ